jgi:glycosyltransferase involved in cell wall biosynthesis
MRAFHSIYGPSMVPELVAGLARLEPRVTAAMYGPDKGDGSLEITRRRVEALGIAERIEFGGVVEKAKVPSILARADIFLNTSLVDNAPVILSEAMACGLCVVTSGAGGIPDIVTDGETGLVVSNGASAFQGAVARLLRDEALAHRLSTAARRVAERLDWVEILPSWETLLERAAATGERRT